VPGPDPPAVAGGTGHYGRDEQQLGTHALR
jgi:hypothetical protein